jgi:hypothetical protein
MTFDVQKTQEYDNAKPYELIAQRIITHANNVQVIEDDDTPGRPDYQKSWFDFRTSDQITYEVKQDSRSINTGNFFIAGMQSFKNETYKAYCGICKTKADYYMLLFGNEFYKIDTDIIIDLLLTNTYKVARYGNKRGDTIYGILLPVAHVKPFAEVYSISGFE